MPLLRVEDLERLNATPPMTCLGCRQAIRYNYCRQHDVFFWAGHMAGCQEGVDDDHDSHRTY